MNKSQKKFDSLDELGDLIESSSIEIINEFIHSGPYSIKISSSEDSKWVQPYDGKLLKYISVTDKNKQGLQITDKATKSSFWLNYWDFLCTLVNLYPLALSLEKDCKGYKQIGFYTPTYAEFKIDWETFFDDDLEGDVLEDKVLEFMVDNVLVTISLCSPIWNYLIGKTEEPTYYGIAHYGRFWYWVGHRTIKFSGCLPNDIESLISQALFIINSRIEPEDLQASIGYVETPDDFLMYSPGMINLLNSKREKHTSLPFNDPIKLFNASSDFLGYYRVLEYFFPRARTDEFEQIRWDNKLSPEKFISEVERIYKKSENKSLELLIKQIVDSSIYEVALKSRICLEKTPEALASKIYGIRNNVVHSKQNENPEIPSVFPYIELEARPQIRLIRLLAIRAIEKYCHSKSFNKTGEQ